MIPTVSNANEMHERSLTEVERVALWVVDRIGTVGFFLFCVLLATTPIILPSTMPVIQYVSSGYLQLILLPLILLGQNLQGRHSEARAEADFKVNLKAEQEVMKILKHLEYQNGLLLKILNK